MWRSLVLATCSGLVFLTNLHAADEATHVQSKTVSVKGEGGTSIQTLAATPDGKVVTLVSLSRYANFSAVKNAVPEVRVFAADGTELSRWNLDFLGQSIGVGPDGAVYVAGDGQVAAFSVTGKLLAKAEVPHLAEVLKDQDTLRAEAEAQAKARVASIEQAKKSFTEAAKALRDKGEDKLTAVEKAQLQAYELNLKLYDQLAGQTESVDKVMDGLTRRLRIINSISATSKHVFIATGELKGYGYAVWRMDLDFKNPTQVLSKLSGCCGQMDVQAHGDRLYVAENTRHRVGLFDLTGTPVSTFGKRERESVGDCFAGCCNPMNCRILDSGDVYTAESEGIIKKFNSKGEFVALVGVAKLTGGCKNVAVAATQDGETVFFCDQPGSQIIFLKKAPVAAAAAAAE